MATKKITDKQPTRFYQVLIDGWIPDKMFDCGQEKQRDAYINYCRQSYQGNYSYVVQWNSDNIKQFCKAVGF